MLPISKALAAPISETTFQAAVIQVAVLLGWMAYHTHDSRRSEAGFMDLVLVRDGALYCWELKNETGDISPEQGVWLTAMSEAIGADRVGMYRPSDRDLVYRMLE